MKSLEKLAMADPFHFADRPKLATADNLTEEYILVPAQIKTAYLAQIIARLGPGIDVQDDVTTSDALTRSEKARLKAEQKKLLKKTQEATPQGLRAPSCIVFTATCRGCQVVAETLKELGINCAPLHSQLTQRERLISLTDFKSSVVKVLVATDVASRGLDIPQVCQGLSISCSSNL